MTARAKTKKEEEIVYDGAATQRIAFEVGEGSGRYETAHVLKPVTDAVQLDSIEAFDGDLNKLCEVWRELVQKVENTETEPGDDFRDLISRNEINAAMTALMYVAIDKPETATGVRKLSASVITRTKAIFNGKLLTQTHTLRRRSEELQKRYDAIFEGEDTKPRDRAVAIAGLYDSLMEKVEGFKGNKVPLRFKLQVVDDYFRGTRVYDPKK